jgi:hypothetical protein
MDKISVVAIDGGGRLSKDDLPELASLAQFGAVMGLSILQVRALIEGGRLDLVHGRECR